MPWVHNTWNNHLACFLGMVLHMMAYFTCLSSSPLTLRGSVSLVTLQSTFITDSRQHCIYSTYKMKSIAVGRVHIHDEVSLDYLVYDIIH
jgi:hypothetical protein